MDLQCNKKDNDGFILFGIEKKLNKKQLLVWKKKSTFEVRNTFK